MRNLVLILVGPEEPNYTVPWLVHGPGLAAAARAIGAEPFEKEEGLRRWVQEMRARGVGLRVDVTGEKPSLLFSWPDGRVNYRDVTRAEANFDGLLKLYCPGLKLPKREKEPELPLSCFYGGAPPGGRPPPVRPPTSFALSATPTPIHVIPLDPSLPLSFLPLSFVDLETTGLDPAEDRVIEIAICRVDPNGERPRWATGLVNPEGRASSRDAQAQHKIDPALLVAAPLFSSLAPRLRPFLEGSVFVAHHAPFDLSFLTASFARASLLWAPSAVIDTCELARRLLPGRPSYALGALLSQPSAHRAREDVGALRKLWALLLEKAPASPPLSFFL